MILVADLLACIDVDEHRHRSLSGFLLLSEDPGAQGMLAQSRHTTVKVLPRSVKRTTKQIATGTTKRRPCERKPDIAPKEHQPACPNKRLGVL
jgi:hypothetical protein